MAEIYREEIGSVIAWINTFIIAAIVISLIIYPKPDRLEAFSTVMPLIVIIMLVVTFAFRKLTITIDREYLRFGFSIIKTKIKISDIESCEKTKINWAYGIGPKRWMNTWRYTARPGDAVVIKLKNKKVKYMFSTNKPDTVCRVLKEGL